LEETEIITEQPLSSHGRFHSPFARESSGSAPLSDEEQEDDTVNEGGWVTVDEDDLPAQPLPARSDRGSSSSSSRRSVDDRHIPDVPSLTLSTSTTTSSLPTLSPTREGLAAMGRRNLSSDSGRYGDVIHECNEDGPLTPIDGEEELLKPRLPSPAARVMLSTNSSGGTKRVRLNPLGLDVASAPDTM
jgi:hypothetical protein